MVYLKPKQLIIKDCARRFVLKLYRHDASRGLFATAELLVFHRRVAAPFYFSVPNVVTIFRREPPNGGVECRWGRQKSLFSNWVAGYRSMTGGIRTTATVHRAVYHTERHASVNLCLSQPAWTTTMNSFRQNKRTCQTDGKLMHSIADVEGNRRRNGYTWTHDLTEFEKSRLKPTDVGNRDKWEKNPLGTNEINNNPTDSRNSTSSMSYFYRDLVM